MHEQVLCLRMMRKKDTSVHTFTLGAFQAFIDLKNVKKLKLNVNNLQLIVIIILSQTFLQKLFLTYACTSHTIK